MLKRTILLACFLLLSGFSAQAQALFTARLGDYGLESVSEITQFFTGNGKLWTHKGVHVYTPNGNRRYRKTNWQMKHLPKGAIVKIDWSLAPVQMVTLHIPKTIGDICNQIHLWKCTERFLAFNPPVSGPKAHWIIPEFVPPTAIPNPEAPQAEPPPPPPVVTAYWWKSVPTLQNLSLLLFALALFLTAWIVYLYSKLEKSDSVLYPEPPRRVGTERVRLRRSFRTVARDAFNRLWKVRVTQESTTRVTPESQTSYEQTTVTPEHEPSDFPQSPLGLHDLPAEPVDEESAEETEHDRQARARKIKPVRERVEEAETKRHELTKAFDAENIAAEIDTYHWPTIEVRVPEANKDLTNWILKSQRQTLGFLEMTSNQILDTERNVTMHLFSLRF